ncbi:MAG TPA: hypothetical protein PLH22_01330 [Candidatus Colwellbacteria bacterium]|nr:hypothetical protein [Candidatus Colwellbacteria bacterium]
MYDYWSLSLPTDIENWPPGLLERSIDTVFVRLTQEQATALIATNSYGLEMRGEKEPEAAAEVLDELRLILSNVISDRFPDGAFVRLGSRSPKDSFDGIIHGFKCHNGQRVLELLNDSERVYDDLALAKHHSYLPVLALRKWIDIADWQEFRSFVKNRKLAGISQYYYYDFYPGSSRGFRKSKPLSAKNAGLSFLFFRPTTWLSTSSCQKKTAA